MILIIIFKVKSRFFHHNKIQNIFLVHQYEFVNGKINQSVDTILGFAGSTSLTQNNDVIMGTMAYHITSLTIAYSTVYSGADQIKHQSSTSLAFVWGIHRGPMNSPHKWPVARKVFPFDDVIVIIFLVVVMFLYHCCPFFQGYWLALTHLSLDRMAAIYQTTFKNSFSWMKRFVL